MSSIPGDEEESDAKDMGLEGKNVGQELHTGLEELQLECSTVADEQQRRVHFEQPSSSPALSSSASSDFNDDGSDINGYKWHNRFQKIRQDGELRVTWNLRAMRGARGSRGLCARVLRVYDRPQRSSRRDDPGGRLSKKQVEGVIKRSPVITFRDIGWNQWKREQEQRQHVKDCGGMCAELQAETEQLRKELAVLGQFREDMEVVERAKEELQEWLTTRKQIKQEMEQLQKAREELENSREEVNDRQILPKLRPLVDSVRELGAHIRKFETMDDVDPLVETTICTINSLKRDYEQRVRETRTLRQNLRVMEAQSANLVDKPNNTDGGCERVQ